MRKEDQSYMQKIVDAARFIQQHVTQQPTVGLILGSGLGDLADEVEHRTVLPFNEIPHFPVSTVQGHAGELVYGQLQGVAVLIMKGRFHYYEGYPMRDVVFPVYVMRKLGVQKLIVTNAAGGMNAAFSPGDLMLINDHINFTGNNPLIGPNFDELGTRFPDMSEAYHKELRTLAARTAEKLGIPLQQGVYAGISGPSYCTPAELKMMALLGGDAVGMSTVPEAIAASHCGLQTLGISCITDMAIGDELEPLSHEQVVQVAAQTKPKFIRLVKAIVAELRSGTR